MSSCCSITIEARSQPRVIQFLPGALSFFMEVAVVEIDQVFDDWNPMAKTVVRDFAAGPSTVLVAFRQAVAQLGYTIIASNDAGHVITFNTGRSWKSWAGQDLQASVIALDGNSQVVVGGTIARRGGLSGIQLIAWGEKANLSRKFLDRVSTNLLTSSDPSIL